MSATWRLVLARLRADWLITAAGGLVILVATTLLSSGVIYADAVTEAGAQRALADAPVHDTNLQLSSWLGVEQIATADPVVRETVADVFDGRHVTVARIVRSASFALPQQPSDAVRNLAIFGVYEGIAQHASVSQGAWPAARRGSSRVIEVAIPERLMADLNIKLGDSLRMPSRLHPELVVEVRVAGIYRVDTPGDPYWWADPFEVEGVTASPTYTTYGPIVIADTDFSAVGGPETANVLWRLSPNLQAFDLAQSEELRSQVDRVRFAVEAAIEHRLRVGIDLSRETGLGLLLRTIQRALLATRTGVLLLLVQLVALASYALLLTAALLVEQRRVESAMLHARGATNGQLVALAIAEGAVLALPSAAVAPWLAAQAVDLFNRIGPLADIGVRLEPQVTPAAYLAAAVGAAIAVIGLVTPAARAARSLSGERQARGRQGRAGLAQRIGLDVAFLIAAAVGLWQLRSYGTILTSQVRGGLGIDPLLVAAPAIGLVAGSILALRLVPLLAQAAELASGRLRGAVGSLGAWQLARRPLRYSRSALLLTLAVALGSFATQYVATWRGSQHDQAAHQVGADLRVAPDRRTGSLPVAALPAAFRLAPGAPNAMGVLRGDLTLSSGDHSQLILLDATSAGAVLVAGDDQTEAEIAALMRPLAKARPRVTGPILPGSPVRIAADLSLRMAEGPDGRLPQTLAVRMLVSDGEDLIHEVDLGELPLRDGAARLVATVGGSGATAGSWIGLLPPVRLLSVSATAVLLRAHSFRATLIVRSVHVSASSQGSVWQSVDLDGDWKAVRVGDGSGGSAEVAPAADGQLGLVLTAAATTESRPFGPEQKVRVEYAMRQASLSVAGIGALPVIVTRELTEIARVDAGDHLILELAQGRTERALVVGVLNRFPTGAPDQPLIVGDLPTVSIITATLDGAATEPNDWWLRVSGGSHAALATAVRSKPFSSPSVLDLDERTHSLLADPLALGVIGALTLGFVAAALFAAIGFAVSAAVSTRERVTEFAVLRALGLSPPQLAGLLAAEHLLLVAVSLIAGTALGLLLGWLVLPFATMRREPGPVVPPPQITVPWDSIAMLLEVVLVVLVVTVAGLVVVLRRIGLGSALRLGED